jgi:predicted nucleotidyltransferase
MLREKRFLPKNALDARAKELIAQKIKALLSSHQNIVFAYIFGSFVYEKLFRDIDMAFFIRTKPSFKLESDLSFALSDAAGYDVEMKALNNAPLSFQMKVLKEGKLLFSRDEKERTDFIERISYRYREFTHFRNLFLEIAGKQDALAPEFQQDRQG